MILQIAGNFAANNSEVLREAALRGLGIALVPDLRGSDPGRAKCCGSIELVYAEENQLAQPFSNVAH